MTIAKVQHYVPQFLMRNFGNGKKDQVWVYDKSSNRSFPSNTKNLASENRFYDFEYQGQPLSIEPWLSELEGHAKLVISTILDADSLSSLADEQKHILASFLAVQLTRTKTFREECPLMEALGLPWGVAGSAGLERVPQNGEGTLRAERRSNCAWVTGRRASSRYSGERFEGTDRKDCLQRPLNLRRSLSRQGLGSRCDIKTTSIPSKRQSINASEHD
jgi:hypothetical protein